MSIEHTTPTTPEQTIPAKPSISPEEFLARQNPKNQQDVVYAEVEEAEEEYEVQVEQAVYQPAAPEIKIHAITYAAENLVIKDNEPIPNDEILKDDKLMQLARGHFANARTVVEGVKNGSDQWDQFINKKVGDELKADHAKHEKVLNHIETRRVTMQRWLDNQIAQMHAEAESAFQTDTAYSELLMTQADEVRTTNLSIADTLEHSYDYYLDKIEKYEKKRNKNIAHIAKLSAELKRGLKEIDALELQADGNREKLSGFENDRAILLKEKQKLERAINDLRSELAQPQQALFRQSIGIAANAPIPPELKSDFKKIAKRVAVTPKEAGFKNSIERVDTDLRHNKIDIDTYTRFVNADRVAIAALAERNEALPDIIALAKVEYVTNADDIRNVLKISPNRAIAYANRFGAINQGIVSEDAEDENDGIAETPELLKPLAFRVSNMIHTLNLGSARMNEIRDLPDFNKESFPEVTNSDGTDMNFPTEEELAAFLDEPKVSKLRKFGNFLMNIGNKPAKNGAQFDQRQMDTKELEA